MLNKTFAIVFLLGNLLGYSQDVISTIPMNLKGNKEVFQIVNDSAKQVSLFISDKKGMNAIRLDNKMQIIDSITTIRPNKTYSTIAGFISNGSKQNLFWSSADSKEFMTQNFDFENKAVSNKSFSLNLQKEIELVKFSTNNKFYLLTVLKNTNFFKLYTFDIENNLTVKTINLDQFHFFNSQYNKVTLYDVMRENLYPFEDPFSLQKISTDSPVSLTYSSKKRKCYFKDNLLIITIDTNRDYTQIITLNLDTLAADEKIIKTPYLERINDMDENPNSNSFLIDNKLYQIRNNPDILIFNIKDLNDQLLYENKIINDQSVTFANSEITQYSESGSVKTLGKSNQFLRKVYNLGTGLSCYNLGGDYLVTFGGVSPQATNSTGIALGAALGGLVGTLIAAAILSPTYDNFNAYANRKVVFITSVFNSDNKHRSGAIQPTAFDKIRTFDINNELVCPTIFKLDGNYYLGSYDDNVKKYSIRKFTD